MASKNLLIDDTNVLKLREEEENRSAEARARAGRM
jgi:hypothetical protein